MSSGRVPYAALVLAALLAPCAGAAQVLSIPLGLDAYMPVPADNPLTPEKIALGAALFSDPMLSADRTTSCASCHDPNRAFTDGRRVAVGVFGRTGARATPALLNRGYGSAFFWDGRATTLEAQVLEPIQNPNELGTSVDQVIARLMDSPHYVAAFANAFGDTPRRENLSRALASFVRSIRAGGTPVDRFVNGEHHALTDQERHGLRIFRGKANCTACHIGPAFSDERFHNTGVAWRTGAPADEGRFRVTARAADRGAFKTPTLREIARTAPYMHDGAFDTLAEVITFYDGGGHANPHLDPEVRPLKLTEPEKQALESFLRALSGEVRAGRE
jgi:cytochrome c peroxidase